VFVHATAFEAAGILIPVQASDPFAVALLERFGE
jgi:hypothetical protein